MTTFTQEQAFCVLHCDKYHHKWGWTKAEWNRETQAAVVFVRLLCNLWQRSYMFVVFHFDNHLLITGRAQHKQKQACTSQL